MPAVEADIGSDLLLPKGLDEAALTVEADIGSDLLLPKGLDEAALKRKFKKLAAIMHPDVNENSEDAVARFQELTEEYAQRRQECRDAQAREELEVAWLRLGGMAAAATLVFNANPVVPATVLATVKGIDVVADKVGNLVGGIDRHALEAADRAVAAEESRERAAEEEAAAAVVAKRQALYLRGYRNIAVIKENVAAQAEAEAAALASLAEKFKARARQRWVGARALHIPIRAPSLSSLRPSVLRARRQAARARREERHAARQAAKARAAAAAERAEAAAARAARKKKAAALLNALVLNATAVAEEAEADAAARAAMAAAEASAAREARERAAIANVTAQDYHAVTDSLGGLGGALASAAGDVLLSAVMGTVDGVASSVAAAARRRQEEEEEMELDE